MEDLHAFLATLLFLLYHAARHIILRMGRGICRAERPQQHNVSFRLPLDDTPRPGLPSMRDVILGIASVIEGMRVANAVG